MSKTITKEIISVFIKAIVFFMLVFHDWYKIYSKLNWIFMKHVLIGLNMVHSTIQQYVSIYMALLLLIFSNWASMQVRTDVWPESIQKGARKFIWLNEHWHWMTASIWFNIIFLKVSKCQNQLHINMVKSITIYICLELCILSRQDYRTLRKDYNYKSYTKSWRQK